MTRFFCSLRLRSPRLPSLRRLARGRTGTSLRRIGIAGLAPAGALALACANTGLVIEPPTAPPPGSGGDPVRLAAVSDARTFSTSDMPAPVPSTEGNADDPSWTQRVFGRQRTSMSTLGGDQFTTDPAGVPALVRAALAAGLGQAGRPVVRSPDAPALEAVIESFWVNRVEPSASAKLDYRAEVVISGDAPGFDRPLRVKSSGSIVAGGADGVLWRRAVERCLEELAENTRQALSTGGASASLPTPDLARADVAR